MAKVLNGISLDAPASPQSLNASDQFTFAGTPSFSGSGGVQRYDWKWEVNDGGGYVTIAASGTGLTTAGTNPVINGNSQTQNSLTVVCDQAGSYTIRLVGAPTTGGAYAVFSATQTVEVSADVSADAPVVGVPASGLVGGVTVTASATQSLGGVATLGAVGSPTPDGAANATPTGTDGTGSIGSLSVSTESGEEATALPTGVVGEGAVTTLTVAADAGQILTGITGLSAVGTPSVVGSAVLTCNGLYGEGWARSPTPTGTASLLLTGLTRTGAVGMCGVAITTPSTGSARRERGTLSVRLGFGF